MDVERNAAVKSQFRVVPLCGSSCEARHLTGGSDRDRLREIDALASPLIRFLSADSLLNPGRHNSWRRYSMPTSRWRITKDQWAEVGAKSRYESLRTLAGEFGASHATIRAILVWAQELQLPGRPIHADNPRSMKMAPAINRLIEDSQPQQILYIRQTRVRVEPPNHPVKSSNVNAHPATPNFRSISVESHRQRQTQRAGADSQSAVPSPSAPESRINHSSVNSNRE
ncbi:hypothetical protein BH23CHL5_BH23CHL5_27720 [soil metagenome]